MDERVLVKSVMENPKVFGREKTPARNLECALGEKGFDFIIYHVLLGLNVYSRSKTQKSEI
jgi:hypothetical protein